MLRLFTDSFVNSVEAFSEVGLGTIQWIFLSCDNAGPTKIDQKAKLPDENGSPLLRKLPRSRRVQASRVSSHLLDQISVGAT